MARRARESVRRTPEPITSVPEAKKLKLRDAIAEANRNSAVNRNRNPRPNPEPNPEPNPKPKPRGSDFRPDPHESTAPVEKGEPGKAAQLTILTVTVSDGDFRKYFRISRKTTKLGRVFNNFAKLRGVAPNLLRFAADGKHLDANKTAELEELEDGAEIDVFHEQQGGGVASS